LNYDSKFVGGKLGTGENKRPEADARKIGSSSFFFLFFFFLLRYSKSDRVELKGVEDRFKVVWNGKDERDGEVEYGMAEEEWECVRSRW
jgi:hypothetical protein